MSNASGGRGLSLLSILVVAALWAAATSPTPQYARAQGGTPGGGASGSPRARPSGSGTSGLHVVFAAPRGSRTAGTGDAVLVTFDRPMVALGEAAPALDHGPLRFEPDVPGTYRWLGSRTLEFRPGRLPGATEFQAIVPAGTAACDGSRLGADYRWTFESARPKMVATLPVDGARWVQPGQRILLRFNQPVTPARAAPKIRLTGTSAHERKHRPRVTVRSLRGGEARRSESPRYLSDATHGDERDAEQEAMDRGWPADRTLVVEPQEPLWRDTAYALTVGADLLAREGNLGMAAERTLAFSTVGTFAFRGVVDAARHDAEEHVTFEFTQPVYPKDLARLVRFVPPVRLLSSVDRHRASASPTLPVALEPSTRYRIEIPADLADRFGNRLGKPVRATLVTMAYEPRVLAPLGLRSLEAYLEPEYPLALLNASRVRVQASRVDLQDVVPSLQMFGEGRWSLPHRVMDRMLPPPRTRNRMHWLPVDLTPALSQGRFGHVIVHVANEGGKNSESIVHSIGNPYEHPSGASYVQVTSMALTAKFSPENSLIMATNLRDASPVAGARVELRDTGNKVVWRGRTDASGVTEAPGWRRLDLSEHESSDPTLFAFVTKGPDLAVVGSDWGSTVWPGAFGIERAHGWRRAPSDVHLFTDRGLYRPGDTVQVKGLVRSRRGDAWVMPSEKSVRVRVVNSRSDEVLARDVPLSAMGSFDLSVPLDASAPTGRYRIESSSGVHDASTSAHAFRVEAYRPAQFEVRVETPRADLVEGDAMAARVSGHYLFGASMPGEKVEWSITAAPTAFEPPGWSEFSFGVDPWLQGEREDEARAASRVVTTGSSLLDARGSLAVAAPMRFTQARGSVRATVEARVTGPDGAILAGRRSVLVHRSTAHVGMRMSSSFVQVGRSIPVQVVAVGADGSSLPGRRINVSLVRREWSSVRRLSRHGDSQWMSSPRDRVVFTTDVTSAAKGVTASLPVKTAGFHYVRARTTDPRGRIGESRQGLWAWGEGYASWERQRDDRLTLVSDRRSYAPGDRARVMIQSPFAKARALVTVERDTVVRHFVQDVRGTTPVVTLPIVESDAPNVFVSVVLLQGRTGTHRFDASGEDLARPAFRMGYLRLPVDAKAHHLQVEIVPGQERYRPGETVTVDVNVRDAAGQGREAEVTLVAADLGVLNLVDYHIPDPFKTFFAERRLDVATSETLHHVIGQRRYGEKGRPAGDGGPGNRTGDVSGSYRWQFDATATWQPSLRTDASGHVRATFKLPDSVTSFRLSAVAHTADARFGEAEKEIVARKPLMLTAAWPRFCRVGDHATAGVVVHNQGDRAGEAQVRLLLAGATIEGAAERTIHLEAGRSSLVRFPFHAPVAGKATFRFDASLGGEQDGLRADIPVLLPQLLSTTATSDSTEGTLTIPVDFPRDVVPGTARMELTLASSGLGGLRSCLEYLQGYKYECLEQKTSRVMPIVVARDVVDAFGLKAGEAAYGRALVQEVLKAMPSHQTSSGGLSLWPGGRPSPYATAYAMILAARARDQGYDVSKDLADATVVYMKRALNVHKAGDEDWPYPYCERELLATRAYLLHALSLWGEEDPAALAVLYEKRADLTLFGQSMLLKTAGRYAARPAASGTRPTYAGEREELRRILLNRLRSNPTTAWFEGEGYDLGWIYDSRTRTTAVILETLLESGEDFPQAAMVVRWLVANGRSGCWRTTQENAAVFGALSAWFRRYEATAPDFTAEVRISGHEVLREAFRGRDLRITSRTVPMGEGRGQVPLRIGKSGQGRLYFGARLRYASRAAVPPLDAGMGVMKTVQPMEGAKVAADGTWAAGTLLKVTLVVTTSEARRFVVLDDPIGGGMEVLHTDFETERRDLAGLLQDDDGEKRWWGTFDHFEIYDDRVLLFADQLEPGPHRYSYFVRATHPGRYFVPATQVEQMYEPEVFGRTGQGVVTIR